MTVQDAILQIQLRADKWDDNSLVNSFVKVGSLIPLLDSENNQIIFGRRGTGKTHVLRYFKNLKEKQDDCCIFVDLRKIGSSNSIYADQSLSIEQRALRFFIDIIKVLSDEIISYIIISDEHKEAYLCEIPPLIDQLNHTWTKSAIMGEVVSELSSVDKSSHEFNSGIFFSPYDCGLNISTKDIDIVDKSSTLKLSGRYYTYINLLDATSILQKVADILFPHKIWLIFDEFSELSPDIQIVLADILRRVICPVRGFTFKIGAIEHRSNFRHAITGSNYLGIELGADVSTINLDELMVFGNNHASSLSFFRDLLFQRVNTILPPEDRIASSDDLVKSLFTQESCFEELVLAAEGVPRDFFNVLHKAIILDYYNRISIPIIRKAARNWFDEDKRGAISAIPNTSGLLDWIISDVINTRQARAFMLKSNENDNLINYLYDARILHIIKQNISSKDTPGVRFNVYSIDYGCYVDLINTARAPKGLFEAEIDDSQTEFIDVPRDDYRSIRRAILDLSEFYASI
ncbi:MAG: ATP-binding protein [Muribaculaceae bacterium]|nr:ATP-binding protein [Muribaculaceae bacterium]